MSPPSTADEATRWPDWREDTYPLEYEGHDVRIIFGEQLSDTVDVPRPEPATFGEFDPNPDDPDPDAWPLEYYDLALHIRPEWGPPSTTISTSH
ncbi:hypothetical protein [Haloarcula amylovorans]|uniref:hypothetical protein n=1 Tax=Haloarcula amylovorans TaxID=2562280 RepID=UPI001076078E|nr:hypothetical protein [Halomicroarcula amylolytica]